MANRSVGVLGAAVLILGTSVVASSGSQARPLPAGPAPVAHAASAKLKSKATGVHFTSNTVTLSRGFVKSNLIGISSVGIFKSSTPPGRSRT